MGGEPLHTIVLDESAFAAAAMLAAPIDLEEMKVKQLSAELEAMYRLKRDEYLPSQRDTHYSSKVHDRYHKISIDFF